MAFLVVALLLFLLFDAHYFLRAFVFFAYLFTKRSHRKPFDKESTVYGFCSTTDLDLMFHMNNARYLRELDFGRFDFYARNGLYLAVRECGGGLVQSACSIRYRKAVTFLQLFRIKTKALYWDERNIYLEQRLETLHDNFVRAVALVKQTTVGPTSVTQAMTTAYGSVPQPPSSPPPELSKWIESNEHSSHNLRNN